MTLTCTNLLLKRHRTIIAKNLGFSLLSSGLILIKGKNGSGKSTLLKSLAGIIRPARGKITYCGHPIESIIRDYPKSLHYLGHELAFKEKLTVLENLEFWANMFGTELMLPAALHFFQLEAFTHKPYRTLSAGLQQRVALSRVMISSSKLWLLDEPTNHLDEDGCNRCHHMISERCQSGGMVIVTSHTHFDQQARIKLHLEDFKPTSYH